MDKGVRHFFEVGILSHRVAIVFGHEMTKRGETWALAPGHSKGKQSGQWEKDHLPYRKLRDFSHNAHRLEFGFFWTCVFMQIYTGVVLAVLQHLGECLETPTRNQGAGRYMGPSPTPQCDGACLVQGAVGAASCHATGACLRAYRAFAYAQRSTRLPFSLSAKWIPLPAGRALPV